MTFLPSSGERPVLNRNTANERQHAMHNANTHTTHSYVSPRSNVESENLQRNTAAVRNLNPMNHVNANTYSCVGPNLNTSTYSTHSYTYLPSVPSSSVTLGLHSSKPLSNHALFWVGVALAVTGVALITLGLVVIAPELFVLGIASAIVGGAICASSALMRK